MNLSCFALQELFVETIAKDAYVYAQQGKRKTLQRKDLGMFCAGLSNGLLGWGFFHLSGGAEAIMDSLVSLKRKTSTKDYINNYTHHLQDK